MFELEKLKRFSVHPLFLVVGIVYSLTGKLIIFLVYTLSALLHECAHAFYAERIGYRLDKIVLMPYGAAVKGNIEGIGVKDEVILCLCGPLCNACVAVSFVALWWFFPDTYAFTDEIVFANAALFLVNLLPAFPLDGGRILYSLIKRSKGERTAEKVSRILSILLSVLLIGLFVLSCFYAVNFSLLFFAVLLLVGSEKTHSGAYEKMSFSFSEAFKRGVEVKHIAVDENCTVKKAMRFLSKERYLVLDIYDKAGNRIRSMGQGELASAIEKMSIYDKISNYYT